MNKVFSLLAAAVLTAAGALPASPAQAWFGGPWGGNMFGMDMGQSDGYPGYYGPSGSGGGWGGPWGGNMFGMDMGQSRGYRPYYGAPSSGAGDRKDGSPGDPE